ncbi:hypothetical protein DFQ12_0384 [Sphingobacterium detergens]|uniref:Uncharacterized protein n=1 Tax=Sphingobacterium detergens TaxID=1145106 RepID=A0A420BFS0_SPHD1|nr:hypothetical protein DFQ12_0384 [Sphingobacterium detergens]
MSRFPSDRSKLKDTVNGFSEKPNKEIVTCKQVEKTDI